MAYFLYCYGNEIILGVKPTLHTFLFNSECQGLSQ